jgi:YYY domain-containing protein
MWPVVCWWVVLELIGVATLPLLFPLLGARAAHGYPFAKIVGLLILSYLTWLGAYLMPLPAALSVAAGALVVAAGAAAGLQRAALAAWLRDGGARTVLLHALLWTGGFLFFAWQRAMAPDIFGAEKYMDFAFLNLLARTDAMPPQDPWMNGETINYYYFGYLTFANLVRIVPLPSYVSYNLCIATIGGSAFALSGAVVVQLTQRWGLALLGGAMSALLGNLDGFLQLVEKGTLRGMDYWRSSRVVAKGDTINEFPFFSTIHGDLHPHFMVLPVGITLLALLLDDRWHDRATDGRTRRLAAHGLVAFILGAMIAISPWELPTAAVVSFLLLGRAQSPWPLVTRARLELAGRLAALFVIAYLLFLPFYLEFAAPPGGVGWQVAQSSLGEFLTVFGGLLFVPAVLALAYAWPAIPFTAESRQLLVAAAGLLILVAAVAGNGVLPFLIVLIAAAFVAAYASDDPEDRRGFLLIACAAIPLLACELVYLKDAYGLKLYRMNTVFKLYFQAWTILAIAAPWSVHRLVSQRWGWRPLPQVVLSGLALLLAASACYPLGITSDRLRGRTWTLDGNAYLQREHPDDYAALNWLRANAQLQDVLLEATGNPYSYFARFSSNSGNPTVLGWANHEGLWRGHDQEVTRRHTDVVRMYNSTSLDEARALLDQYKVHWVIVGDLEHETYKREGLEKFARLDVAFRSGRTTIYEYK